MKMLGNTADRGPGGRDCSCCGVAPRHRKAETRTLKRRERNEWRKALTNDR